MVRIGSRAFLLADTSEPRDSTRYQGADAAWMKEMLETLENDEQIADVFVVMHISQKQRGSDGWTGVGLRDEPQIRIGAAVLTLLTAAKKVRAVS